MVETIKKDLENMLTNFRYEHSLLVAEEARLLAKHYNLDSEKAYLAGLVHDIAKDLIQEEEAYYINKYKLPRISEEFKRIIHSYVGDVYLKEIYNMDEEICKAVRVHTTASTDMTLLDKIVFVADKIEPGKDYPGIEEEREIARKNIDEAVLLCLENNYKKLISKGKKVYPLSLEVLNYFKDKILN